MICPLPTSYDNIESLGLAEDMQSWVSAKSPLFYKFIAETNPETIIEVGSWKGVSAITLAANSSAHVHCVDTWLGAADHFISGTDKLPRDKWGYPQLFHQFLVNVKASGFSDRITPNPMTSTDGARWLAHKKISAQLIYIDGSHHMDDVYHDCRNYWRLLEPGGIMFGDDHLVFAGVFAGVLRFCCENGIDMKTEEPFWVLRKV